MPEPEQQALYWRKLADIFNCCKRQRRVVGDQAVNTNFHHIQYAVHIVYGPGINLEALRMRLSHESAGGLPNRNGQKTHIEPGQVSRPAANT